MENIVFNLYVKFNDDQLLNKKALVLWKSDNNNPNNKHKNKDNKNNVRDLGAFSGPKTWL